MTIIFKDSARSPHKGFLKLMRLDKDDKQGFVVLNKRDLEPRVLPKQHQNIQHVVYFLEHNTAAKLY